MVWTLERVTRVIRNEPIRAINLELIGFSISVTKLPHVKVL